VAIEVSVGGRTIAAVLFGPHDGHPVFLLHGTPGSRLGPRPSSEILDRLGVRLIAYDRPGYGGSDRKIGRCVADAAADVTAIADHLGLREFAVVGRSGGGPHALACAALLSDRVSRVSALVCPAPRDGVGLDWLDGMGPGNVAEFAYAAAGIETLTAVIERRAAQIRADPVAHLPFDSAELPDADRRVLADPGLRRVLVENFVEALKDSGDGWVDDDLALCRRWGFEPSDIRSPVLLWHGALDLFSPVAHTRWLAERISDVTMVVDPGAGHFGAIAILPQVLAWAVSGELSDATTAAVPRW
jgi:pimeloyl-ACP methyl ester carboxylesterase